MSIRKTVKNRLADSELSLVYLARPETPTSKHPLVFWTQHREHPVEVDLREFANGKREDEKRRSSEKSFSGRPGMIQQLLPAIKENLAVASPNTVIGLLSCLRYWWTILDNVEAQLAASGKPADRVDDVRKLTLLHREEARRSRMDRQSLSRFRGLVDVTRQALGVKPTYWQGLEAQDTEKYLPPLEQREDLRQAVKRECTRVIDQWDKFDRLERLTSEPDESGDAALWRALRYLREIQQRKNGLVPTIEDLNGLDAGGHEGWFFHRFGIRPGAILHTGFVSRRDALAIFTQCMATTGWNAAVMLNLDVDTEFLRDHPKDDPNDPNSRWVLTGFKERAKGAEQMAVGPWKASYLAGSLIKRYLQRVNPLRSLVKVRLEGARIRYAIAKKEAPGSLQTTTLFKEITELQRMQKSIWLYLDVDGQVQALDRIFRFSKGGGPDGKKNSTYLDTLRADLNLYRLQKGKEAIGNVTYRDFRLWFADYLYRSSLGNMLVVMLGLGHKHIGTTQSYVNTNLANRDAENRALEFQEILTDELSIGRIDLTILAFKSRHGEFSQKMEEMLAELRRLPRSRQGIGCKDPQNPPPNVKATPGQPCDSQRCLLCKQHAVLLPESVDGIAMREAELKAMQECLPMTSFVEGGYQMELENQEHALRLFDQDEVSLARAKWALAIAQGKHIVPGVSAVTSSVVE